MLSVLTKKSFKVVIRGCVDSINLIVISQKLIPRFCSKHWGLKLFPLSFIEIHGSPHSSLFDRKLRNKVRRQLLLHSLCRIGSVEALVTHRPKVTSGSRKVELFIVLPIALCLKIDVR